MGVKRFDVNDLTKETSSMNTESLIALKHKIRMLSDISVNNLLDVGCNDGRNTLQYAEAARVKEVYGLDINSNLADAAKAKGVRAYVCDLNSDRIPFENNFFDLVTITEVLEHLHNTDHVIQEIIRVLKSEGYLLISVPNLAAWHSRLALLFGYQPYQCETNLIFHAGTIVELDYTAKHVRAFTLRTLKRFLEKKGFKILQVAGGPSEHVSEIRKRFSSLPMIIDTFLSKYPPLAGHIIILCQKKFEQ
jgi:methionine biosynthesis protein MetW